MTVTIGISVHIILVILLRTIIIPEGDCLHHNRTVILCLQLIERQKNLLFIICFGKAKCAEHTLNSPAPQS